MTNTAKRIGFIGLGLMGHGMAKNLIEGGHSVSIIGNRNRAPVESLCAKGATEAKSPRELVEYCDIIFTCLPNSADVEAVVFGENGILAAPRQGLIHIDATTADPTSTIRISKAYASHGMKIVDAGLARGPDNAEAGTLNLIVGASNDLLEEIRPILMCCAENIFHAGETGAGHAMKLVNNFIAMGSVSLLSDAMVAGAACGINLQVFYDLISAGGNNSGLFQIVSQSALDGDISRLKFSVANARKDMKYFNSMMSDAGAVSLFAPAVLQAFTLAIKSGRENDFVPCIADVLADVNKLQLRPN